MSNRHYRKFDHLAHVLRGAKNVLLVAHTNPDPDAVGSVVALYYYLRSNYNISVTIACKSDFPGFLRPLFPEICFTSFEEVTSATSMTYDIVIGCDSVDRGFDEIVAKLGEGSLSVAIDHHHDITLEADVSIIDPTYASATEILYDFFVYDHGVITQSCATALLTGIIGDTGGFQHSNTSAHSLSAASALTRLGASVPNVSKSVFSSQKIETLSLWGKALATVVLFPEKRLAVAALTTKDFSGEISKDNVREIATILVNTPAVDVALILFQLPAGIVKASLRAAKNANIDVSQIARTYGGGGHPLAAGFEIPGKLESLPGGGWHVT